MIYRLEHQVPWAYRHLYMAGEARSVVFVRASDPGHARKVASDGATCEGSAVWLDPATKCEPYDPNGPPEVLG